MDAETAPMAPGVAQACLQPPRLRGWPALQAWLVHRVKRAALRQLHASAAGEILLLRIYLIGEKATEQALQRELVAAPPDWLARQVEHHLAEERQHAQWFTAALRERGAVLPPAEPDRLSRRKIARWQRLAQRHAPHFSHGLLVPAYAVGLCAEQMATRVLQRHCALIGPQHALHPLLARVLGDEDRHVRLCGATLQRCVAPHEQARLAALLGDIRRIERGFGVTGAVAMYLAGLALRLRPGRVQAMA